MPAPAVKRIKYTLIGQVHTAPWESSFYGSYDGAIPVDDAALLDYATAAKSTLNSDWSDEFQAINDPNTNWTALRVDLYLASSLAIAQSATFTDTTLAGVGAPGGAVSSAICTSLYSATPTRSGRGRMYVPATAALAGSSTTNGFTTARLTSWLAALSGAFTAINTLDGPDGAGAVRVGVQSLMDSQIRPVVRVLADTRPDRIEHREKQLTWIRLSDVVAAS